MSRPSSQATPLGASVEKDLRELLLVVFHGRVIVSGLPAMRGQRCLFRPGAVRMKPGAIASEHHLRRSFQWLKRFYNLKLVIPMQGSQEFLHAGGFPWRIAECSHRILALRSLLLH